MGTCERFNISAHQSRINAGVIRLMAGDRYISMFLTGRVCTGLCNLKAGYIIRTIHKADRPMLERIHVSYLNDTIFHRKGLKGIKVHYLF